MVRRVVNDVPAMAAGVKPGDIIAAANGVPVLSMADFYRKVWAQGQPGDPITITVVRESGVHELTIRSGDRYRWLRLQKDL